MPYADEENVEYWWTRCPNSDCGVVQMWRNTESPYNDWICPVCGDRIHNEQPYEDN